MFAPQTEKIGVIADHEERALCFVVPFTITSRRGAFDIKTPMARNSYRLCAGKVFSATFIRGADVAAVGSICSGRCRRLLTNRTAEGATANMALTSSNGT
jgi:hypothetical protein